MGGVSVSPVLSIVGTVSQSIPAFLQSLSSAAQQRASNGAGSDEGGAAAGRVRPKALLSHCPPTMGYSPKMLWLPAPTLSVRDPCLVSEPADNSIHARERMLYPSRPYSILTSAKKPSGHPSTHTCQQSTCPFSLSPRGSPLLPLHSPLLFPATAKTEQGCPSGVM